MNLKYMAALLAVMVTGVASAQKITAAGATFPYPIYNKWFSEYKAAHPGVEINYQSIGSGGGIKQVSDGTVDFGASDGPMNDEQLAQAKVKVMHLPTVLGAVVPIYNLPGLNKELNFSGDVIADISVLEDRSRILAVLQGGVLKAGRLAVGSGPFSRRRSRRE